MTVARLACEPAPFASEPRTANRRTKDRHELILLQLVRHAASVQPGVKSFREGLMAMDENMDFRLSGGAGKRGVSHSWCNDEAEKLSMLFSYAARPQRGRFFLPAWALVTRPIGARSQGRPRHPEHDLRRMPHDGSGAAYKRDKDHSRISHSKNGSFP